MKKTLTLVFLALSFALSANAEPSTSPVSGMKVSTTKIADLEKLVAEGKARKKCDGVYVLPDRFIINGKEHPKTQYGGLYSSSNSEYFLFGDTNMPSEYGSYNKLFGKNGDLLWESKTSHGRNRPSALVSNNGTVAFLYGEFDQCMLKFVDITGQASKSIPGDSREYPFKGEIIEGFYKSEAQFANNSDILFAFAYLASKQFALVGIDKTGKIEYFEKVKIVSNDDMDGWYARAYFNPKRNQVLIDSSGIGDTPPMLSYWSFPQKKIFNRKTVKDEIIYNASFSDNDDILLLVKKKDGSKVVRRLSPAGKEKADKSDISKMDAEEQQLFKKKPLDVRSLRGCENGDKFSPCR